MPDSDLSDTDLPALTYAGAFRCIGPSCEDHCCHEWDIPLDEATYANYQTFPSARLGHTVADFVFRNPPDSSPGMYASIHRDTSGLCPFFGPDKLCNIQREYGPSMLSSSCSIYPRSLSRVDGALEGSLSMSCPEAARQVMLDPDFLAIRSDLLGVGFRTDNVYSPARDGQNLGLIRELLFAITRDRTRSLGERLLLIGSFAEQLDRVIDERALATLLDRYRVLMIEGGLQSRLQAMESNPELRLQLAFTLTEQTVRDRNISPRFCETFWSFVEGIASDVSGESLPSIQAEGPRASDDVRRFLHAQQTYYQNFLESSPHVLENFLINHMIQHLFPFGCRGSQLEMRSCSAEWVLLAVKFIWMETLLIGVAASRSDQFSAEDVIRTVQSFSRATEHDPQVLRRALTEVAGRKLNTLEGMAALLKTR